MRRQRISRRRLARLFAAYGRQHGQHRRSAWRWTAPRVHALILAAAAAGLAIGGAT